MQHAMSASLEIKMSEMIQRSNLPYGIIIDESTDIATKSSLILYIRYIHPDNFVAVTQFLKLLTIVDKDAKTIKQAVKNYLTEMQYNLRLITGFCSDGASVMTGPDNGVAVQLRSDTDFNSNMTAVHCNAHLLPLACLDAMRKSVWPEIAAHFDSYKKFIIALRALFRTSSKRVAALEACQKALDIPQRRVLKYIPTRWMSLYNVSCRFVHNYKALWNCLTDMIEQNKKVKKEWKKIALVLANLQTFAVLSTCHFLTIVLKPLSDFCESMRSNSLTINQLFNKVENLSTQLRDFISNGCPVGVIYEAKASINESSQTFAFKHQNTLEFTGEVEEIKKLESLFFQFASNLLTAIQQRFPSPRIYEALALFDFNIWNKIAIIYETDDEQAIKRKNSVRHNHGNNHIEFLARHFHMTEKELDRQWSEIRIAIYSDYLYVESAKELAVAWKSLYAIYGKTCPDIFYNR